MSAVGKIKEHAIVRHDWSIPRWILYVVGFTVMVALSGVVYGAVSHVRASRKMEQADKKIERWGKILKAAEIRIAELESEKEEAGLRAIQKFVKSKMEMTARREAEIARRLAALRKKKDAFLKDTNRMSPWDLRNAFRKEKKEMVEETTRGSEVIIDGGTGRE